MPLQLERVARRLLESTPNYVEVAAVLTCALTARLLFVPGFWRASPEGSIAGALVVSVFLYACVDKGQLFSYLGWRRPRRPVYWLIAPVAGAAAALSVIWIVRHTGLGLGTDIPFRLLYGITMGPILEEILFRGAAFSVIYVTASSIQRLAKARIALAIVLSSLLFAIAHTTKIGAPWLVFFGMGVLYALFRWQSNSTAATALMHATYNAVIACAMLHW
jgi:membrane protease YdiL (CAAX protease family)